MTVPGDADLLAVTSRVTTSIASLLLTCVLRQNTVFAESMHARLACHVGPLRPLASVGVHGVSATVDCKETQCVQG